MALISIKTTIVIMTRVKRFIRSACRLTSTFSTNTENTTKSTSESDKKRPSGGNSVFEYSCIYPEFLPNPNSKLRNNLREKLEREDMLKRRSQIHIPEFYIGFTLGVTISDPHSQGRNTFVGTCIERKGYGLLAQFTLRNIVKNETVEICYDLYDPTILRIQVLSLHRRHDEKLLNLRDGLPEYSTFPFDMNSERFSKGIIKPWLDKNNHQGLKGVNIEKHLREKNKNRKEIRQKSWEKYDLMKQYRKTVSEEEQHEIWDEVYKHLAHK